MGYRFIDVSEDAGLTTVRLNRIEALNAFNRKMLSEMREILLDTDSDSDCRAVMLTGAGTAFCAGADVKSFAQDMAIPSEPHLNRATPTFLHEVLGIMLRLTKPIVAAVNGPAVGAGFPIATAADIIVASEKAYFALGYLNIGLSPDGSSTFRLPRSIGVHKTFELLALGEHLSAQEAKLLGLVSQVYAAENFRDEAAEFAQRICQLPTKAVAASKALLLRSFDRPLETQLETETAAVVETSNSDDFREGVRSFVEKRAPIFTGG